MFLRVSLISLSMFSVASSSSLEVDSPESAPQPHLSAKEALLMSPASVLKGMSLKGLSNNENNVRDDLIYWYDNHVSNFHNKTLKVVYSKVVEFLTSDKVYDYFRNCPAHISAHFRRFEEMLDASSRYLNQNDELLLRAHVHALDTLIAGLSSGNEEIFEELKTLRQNLRTSPTQHRKFQQLEAYWSKPQK